MAEHGTIGVDHDLNESYKMSSSCVYKIGDFGHVTRPKSSEEGAASDTGDARFLSLERFTETWIDLKKSDIFSFGLT